MRIAFDYQVFAAQRHGGISRYFTALARELALMGEEPRIVAPLYQNDYLRHVPPKLVTGWHEARLPIRNEHLERAVNAIGTRWLMAAWNPQVVHETYYAARRSGPRRSPSVITVFDMIHELFPEQFPGSDEKSEVKRQAVERADHVICISANTRDDLVRLFGCSPDRLSVIHLAADAAPDERSRPTGSPPDERPFVLHVGARSGYKNFARLCEAFAMSSRLRNDMRLVAFGGGGFSPSEIAALERLGLGGVVAQVDGDDALLDTLYRRARALAYPSLYEGFGLPPLEAMARGCPVAASGTSSMPEVIGEAGELFDPSDAAAIARAVETVVYSEERRRALIARGRARAAGFSWRRCAEETLAVYRGVAKRRAAA
jgi:glycosyltransferase involved in cell wall biosynthesis